MNKQERINFIKNERAKRITYVRIAETLKISRQRIHQIINNYTTIDSEKSRKILIRDNFECQLKEIPCYGNKKLEVHHLDGDCKNNFRSNLITVCHLCHMKLEKILRESGIKKRDSLTIAVIFDKKCENCKKTFITKSEKRKFCSMNCSVKKHTKWIGEKICKECLTKKCKRGFIKSNNLSYLCNPCNTERAKTYYKNRYFNDPEFRAKIKIKNRRAYLKRKDKS